MNVPFPLVYEQDSAVILRCSVSMAQLKLPEVGLDLQTRRMVSSECLWTVLELAPPDGSGMLHPLTCDVTKHDKAFIHLCQEQGERWLLSKCAAMSIGFLQFPCLQVLFMVMA